MQRETIVNLFDAYEVENAQKGEHIIVLDPVVHVSLAERPGLNKYLAEYDYIVKDMVTSSCSQVFFYLEESIKGIRVS